MRFACLGALMAVLVGVGGWAMGQPSPDLRQPPDQSRRQQEALKEEHERLQADRERLRKTRRELTARVREINNQIVVMEQKIAITEKNLKSPVPPEDVAQRIHDQIAALAHQPCAAIDCPLALAHKAKPPAKHRVGRYAIIPANRPGSSTRAFLLDTSTGQTWQLMGNDWETLKTVEAVESKQSVLSRPNISPKKLPDGYEEVVIIRPIPGSTEKKTAGLGPSQ